MSIFKNRIRGGSGDGPQKPIDPSKILKTLIHQEGYDYPGVDRNVPDV
ncbi:hypothetical protein K0T92_06080 [Paenibacillus oenotherae]|uniref:Uncharacterized protein n=1 Tax=Paenibacillus oenotherae TaxID=1435645 RepID=A0ABS7D2Y9_9BACL|nr:hypothetical protein [Paenibacillus oenotherae]MBW7474305.1 hypothetical protein [Paenibacillus oenotherae]